MVNFPSHFFAWQGRRHAPNDKLIAQFHCPDSWGAVRTGAVTPLAGPRNSLGQVQGAKPPEAFEIVPFLRVQTGLESSIC